MRTRATLEVDETLHLLQIVESRQPDERPSEATEPERRLAAIEDVGGFSPFDLQKGRVLQRQLAAQPHAHRVGFATVDERARQGFKGGRRRLGVG